MTLQGRRRRLSGGFFDGESYRQMDLRGAIAVSSGWHNCRFEGINFGRARFENATFLGCVFENCQFQQASLISRIGGSTFNKCDFDQASFVAAEISDSDFSNCRFQYADFTRGILRNVQMHGSNFHGANLDFAATTNIDYSGSNLWSAVIPLNCATFIGNRFDRRQVAYLLALVAHAEIDPLLRRDLLSLAGKRAVGVVGRLVQHATAENDSSAAPTGFDASGRIPATVDPDLEKVGYHGSDLPGTEFRTADGGPTCTDEEDLSNE